MPRLTRDSLIWPVAALGAMLAYLAAAEPIPTWGYYDWIQFIAAGVAMVSGYLNKSPLPPKGTA